jgi:ATP-dependent Clp protease protease subunit
MIKNDEGQETTFQFAPGQLLEFCGIYLFTKEVTAATVSDVMRFILESNLNPNRIFDKLQIIINSPGGDLESAFALSDIMQGSKLPIHTTGVGLVASAGLVIFMAGTKGRRIVTPNTMILSHQWSWSSEGKEHELLANVKALELVQDKMLAHYKKFTGLSKTKIKKYLLPPSDVWIAPEDAVKLNIADDVVEPSKQISGVIS